MRERIGRLDLRDNERLCAIALAKRLFPKVARDALDWDIERSHWPSTVYVGALPWIKRVMAAEPGLARQYADVVRACGSYVLAECRPSFVGMDEPAAGDFPRIDANWLHREAVRGERLCPFADDTAHDKRGDLDRLLKNIYDAKDKAGRRIGAPSSFYALLLADGDRLGKMVGNLGRDIVGKALTAFTREAPEIVRKHDGVTVYAGGDDVLAMLPVPAALSCAASLADKYKSAFEDQPDATLSAAVAFVHVRQPLGPALAEAHRLLDDLAKDANGRNSLAAGVFKPGGLNCQWVTTWTRKHFDGGSESAVELLDRLTKRLGSEAAEPGLSSALIYRIREALTALCGWASWRPGVWGRLPEGPDVRAFLHAEIHHSLDARMESGAEARADELTDLVWSVLGRSRAPARGGTPIVEAGVDALLLARFLADPEAEEDGE